MGSTSSSYWRVDSAERCTAARAVVFLHSDIEFNPDVNESLFDSDLWPFATIDDLERAKGSPRLLTGWAPDEELAIQPLTCRGFDQSRESLLERIGLWIPILGWCAAKSAWDFRVGPFVRRIERQLENRLRFPASAWGADEGRLQFARWLCKTTKEEIGWPNDHFHPDDPVRLVFWAYNDGLDIDFLLMAIEEEIGARITDADCKKLERMTIGECVDFLLVRKHEADGELRRKRARDH